MANRFWVGGTGTWNGSNTANWAATTGGAGGQSVPGSADTVTFDGSSGGGIVTVNTNFSVISVTMNTFTGTLDFSANNNSPTMQTFSATGTSTRTLNMGCGLWTITGTGNAWNIATSTNMTLNAGQSKILINNTANPTVGATFNGGGLTYYTVEYARGSVTVTNSISGSNTYTNFIDNTSTAAHSYSWASGTTQTFYNFIVKGSAGALITMGRSGGTTVNFVKVGQGIVSKCNYVSANSTTTATPANTWYLGANGSGGGGGWIVSNAPSSQSLLGAGGAG